MKAEETQTGTESDAASAAVRSRTALHSDPPGILWALPEVAAYPSLSADHRDTVSAVRYLCRTRQLKFVKVGKTLRCEKAWIDDFVEKRAVDPII